MSFVFSEMSIGRKKNTIMPPPQRPGHAGKLKISESLTLLGFYVDTSAGCVMQYMLIEIKM